jgi:hypothetical protein
MEPVVGGALLMFCMSVKPMYATMAMTKIETTATIAELEEFSSDIRVRGKNPAYAEIKLCMSAATQHSSDSKKNDCTNDCHGE